jgi:hypothetical protein
VGPVRLIATSTSLTALLVSPVAFLHLKFSDRPRLAMAFLSNGAAKAQSVITETYKELDVIVPEWLREHSAELLKNQKRAIDLGAVLDTDVDALTVDYFEYTPSSKRAATFGAPKLRPPIINREKRVCCSRGIRCARSRKLRSSS